MAEMEILGAKISDYDMVETVCSAAALMTSRWRIKL